MTKCLALVGCWLIFDPRSQSAVIRVGAGHGGPIYLKMERPRIDANAEIFKVVKTTVPEFPGIA